METKIMTLLQALWTGTRYWSVRMVIIAIFAVPAWAVEVALEADFNLFSFPIEPPANLSCSQLQTQIGADQISRLNAQNQVFERCGADLADFFITAGAGYAVNMPAAGVVQLNGAQSCPLIDLSPGLNLMGVPTPAAAMGCFQLLTALGDNQAVASVQRFNPRSARFESCAWDHLGLSTTPLGTDFPINSGTAYWISMLRARFDVQLNDTAQCPIAPPVISEFVPESGTIGTLVTLNGNNFAPAPNLEPQVTMAKRGGGRIPAPIARFDNTRIQITVPTQAATGSFSVKVGEHQTLSDQVFTVTPSSGFSFSAEPNSAKLIQGRSVSYIIKLESSDGFVQLAKLSAEGLPEGLQASFKPQLISAGQTAILTITAPEDQPSASHNYTVNASAQVDGIDLTDSISLEIIIVPVTTSFIGRAVINDTLQTPLAGVNVSFLGRDGDGNENGCSGSTVADAAGNFAFTDLPQECTGGQLIRYDGSAVTNQPGIYADVDLFYEISDGQVTESPVLIHLPRIDDKETVLVQQNDTEDQTFTFETIPGLEVTFYAGTTLTLKDGSQPNPFPFKAMQIPVDRLPDAMPPNPDVIDPYFVAFQPANTVASQPVAVTFPNILSTPPSTSVGLMTLDPTKGIMVDYGTATVSDDGRQIIPDFDPAFPGHRFGLVHFDWHGPQVPPNAPPPDNPPDKPCTGSCCGNNPGGNLKLGDPVSVSSCMMSLRNADIAIKGPLGEIGITRFYNNFSNVNVNARANFGLGTSDNYSYSVGLVDTGDGQFVDPDNFIVQEIRASLNLPDGNSILFNMKRLKGQVPQEILDLQSDSTGVTGSGFFDRNAIGFPESSVPALRGVLMILYPDDTVAIRWKDGRLMKFQPFPFSISRIPTGSNELESITDRNGNKISFEYESKLLAIGVVPLLKEIIDPAGRKLTLDHNNQGRVTSITDPIGRAVRYTYNNLGAIETFTDTEGGVTLYDYELNASIFNLAVNLLRITDPRGVVIAQNTFDDNDRVTEQIQADGSKFKFDYILVNPASPFSPLLSNTVTDPLGNQTSYRYNPQSYALDVTDALGRTTEFERQPGINQIASITGNAECDVCGNPEAGDVAMTYDQKGNVLTRTDAHGNTTTFTYEPAFDQVSSVTNPLGHVTTFSYDDNGNLLLFTDANNNTTNITYNSLGLAKTITDALEQQIAMDYDATGNLTQITDPLGNTIRMRYDAISRLIATTDTLGRTSHIQYDNLNRVISTTDAKGKKTQFQYDAVGNLLSVIDAKDQTTTYVYEEMKRLISRTDPLGHSETFNYDSNGNLLAHIDRRGFLSQFSYDALNRLQTETYADGSTVAHSYDARGRLIASEDSISGITTFSYDDLGRLIKSSNALGSLEYSYDNMSRMTSRQVVGDDKVDYSYDSVGNLLAATMPQTTIDFSYDALNRLSTLNRANGVETAYAYDAVNRLRAITHQHGTTLLDAQRYSYDSNGNRRNFHTDIGQSLITQASTRSYDVGNRLLTQDGISYDYDENGNRISATGTGGTTTYIWDTRNRLSEITEPDGTRTHFVYDSENNLLSKEVFDAMGAVISQDFLLDDLSNVVKVMSSEGQQTSVLTARNIDTHLAMADSSGNQDYLLSDAINSTLAITDENGAIKQQFAYEPFGETTASGQGSLFQYTGRVPVVDNLYYYRARFYDPKAGRFISEDPIGFGGNDINLHGYVRNNPIQRTDPLGLRSVRPTNNRPTGHRRRGDYPGKPPIFGSNQRPPRTETRTYPRPGPKKPLPNGLPRGIENGPQDRSNQEIQTCMSNGGSAADCILKQPPPLPPFTPQFPDNFPCPSNQCSIHPECGDF